MLYCGERVHALRAWKEKITCIIVQAIRTILFFHAFISNFKTCEILKFVHGSCGCERIKNLAVESVHKLSNVRIVFFFLGNMRRGNAFYNRFDHVVI